MFGDSASLARRKNAIATREKLIVFHLALFFQNLKTVNRQLFVDNNTLKHFISYIKQYLEHFKVQLCRLLLNMRTSLYCLVWNHVYPINNTI